MTERDWEAEYEQRRARFFEWRGQLPNAVVFNDSELVFAAIGICDYFGVDRDSDEECEEVQRILLSEGRELP